MTAPGGAVVGLAPDTCPRCGAAFLCGIAGPGPCPCTTLTLSPARLAELRAAYTGCLCLRCLAALAAGLSAAPKGDAG